MSFLAQEEELDNVTSCTLGRFKGEVEFKDVKFGYDENLPVIKDFSALIESGKRVAIVGPTGAGKTTLVKLLMRFYDLQGGSIKIDGNDITNFSRHDLRAHFGMVLQDAWLFGGTIRENIRYGRLDATDEEVVAAAKVAHVDHFIHTLSGGYDMIINEESSKISQGQRQLITIARAFLANPSILILDEATSNVDTRTEVLIQEAMENLMKDRTSFVIAHRLSTIRNADLILVLKEGDIVEQGTHQELLQKRGFYADLYAAQFEGGKELVS
jgi:ATP-binding cassette subfamily B multidrug efflux pump